MRRNFNPYDVELACGENNDYYAWGFEPDGDDQAGDGWGFPALSARALQKEYEET